MHQAATLPKGYNSLLSMLNDWNRVEILRGEPVTEKMVEMLNLTQSIFTLVSLTPSSFAQNQLTDLASIEMHEINVPKCAKYSTDSVM